MEPLVIFKIGLRRRQKTVQLVAFLKALKDMYLFPNPGDLETTHFGKDYRYIFGRGWVAGGLDFRMVRERML